MRKRRVQVIADFMAVSGESTEFAACSVRLVHRPDVKTNRGT